MFLNCPRKPRQNAIGKIKIPDIKFEKISFFTRLQTLIVSRKKLRGGIKKPAKLKMISKIYLENTNKK